MTQWLRALAVLSEAPHPFLSSIWHLTVIFSSSSRDVTLASSPPGTKHSYGADINLDETPLHMKENKNSETEDFSKDFSDFLRYVLGSCFF